MISVRYRPPMIDFPVKPKCQIQYVELDDVLDSTDVVSLGYKKDNIL